MKYSYYWDSFMHVVKPFTRANIQKNFDPSNSWGRKNFIFMLKNNFLPTFLAVFEVFA